MVGDTLKTLLTIAWLLPLFGFAIEMLWGRKGDRKTTKWPAWMSVGCIATGFLCSFAALLTWGSATHWAVLESHDEHESHEHDDGTHEHHDEKGHAAFANPAWQLTVVDADEEHSKSDEHHTGEHAGAHEDKEAAPLVYHGTLYTLATFGDLVVSKD
jgi:NADH-quinone oxidoreductase subunit L